MAEAIWRNRVLWRWLRHVLATLAAALALVFLGISLGLDAGELAGWAQAIGTVVAVFFSVWVAKRSFDLQVRHQRRERLELDEQRADALVMLLRRLNYAVLVHQRFLWQDRIDPGWPLWPTRTPATRDAFPAPRPSNYEFLLGTAGGAPLVDRLSVLALKVDQAVAHIELLGRFFESEVDPKIKSYAERCDVLPPREEFASVVGVYGAQAAAAHVDNVETLVRTLAKELPDLRTSLLEHLERTFVSRSFAVLWPEFGEFFVEVPDATRGIVYDIGVNYAVSGATFRWEVHASCPIGGSSKARIHPLPNESLNAAKIGTEKRLRQFVKELLKDGLLGMPGVPQSDAPPTPSKQ